MVLSHFVQEKINNEDYYFPPSATFNYKTLNKIYLLPIYDEFIMGYKNRDAILMSKNSLTPAPTFLFDNTIIINGQITGTWQRKIYKSYINLKINLFINFSEDQQPLLNEAVQQFEYFSGLNVTLQVNPLANR